jgi:hypothetical protein
MRVFKIQSIVGEKMIEKIINWIIQNCEWIFSGIGVTILVGVFAFFRKNICKEVRNEKGTKIEQNNCGQNNTQIGIQNNYYGGNKDDR